MPTALTPTPPLELRTPRYTPFRAKYARARDRVYRPTFWKVAGMVAKGDRGAGAGLSNVMGRLIGGREWQRTDDERSTWAGKFHFEQFDDSPHVRISRTVFYHGLWEQKMTESSRFRSARSLGDFPHGEGLAEFLNGYGVAREEKVLHVAVIQARNLKAMDLFTSDPYVTMQGNRKTFKTQVVKKTLNPVWEEGFELDVTDPAAVVVFQVWDWDFLSKDDFMGGVDIPLVDVADGLPHRKWYKLVDNRKTKSGRAVTTKPMERGELELQLWWTEREQEEDVELRRVHNVGAIKLQAWGRMVLGKAAAIKRQEEKVLDLEYVDRIVVGMQCAYRQRMAWRELRRRRRWRKNAIRIQCFSRRWLARRILAQKRLEYKSSRAIQAVARRRLAKVCLYQLKLERAVYRQYGALVLQCWARSCAASTKVAFRRALYKDQGKYVPFTGIQPWIKTYGRDPQFGSKRLRRIVFRSFYQVSLKHRGRACCCGGGALLCGACRVWRVRRCEPVLVHPPVLQASSHTASTSGDEHRGHGDCDHVRQRRRRSVPCGPTDDARAAEYAQGEERGGRGRGRRRRRGGGRGGGGERVRD